jgi:hypothetical protein
MLSHIPRFARSGGEGGWITWSWFSAVGRCRHRQKPHFMDQIVAGLAGINGLAVSGSSTKTVDNPVEKVFDTRMNAADSLAFLRID